VRFARNGEYAPATSRSSTATSWPSSPVAAAPATSGWLTRACARIALSVEPIGDATLAELRAAVPPTPTAPW
jgi:hypothetical protein